MMQTNIPKGYQQTALGLTPQDWNIGNFQQFWTVTDCKHLTAKFVDVGIPVASIREVQSRFVELENAKKTTENYYLALIEGGRKPQLGDLIFSRNVTVGEVAQVAEWHPPFAMGQDVCLLRKKQPEFSSDYMQAIIQSPIVLKQLADLMVGSTFKRVNIEQIRNLIVPMPSPEEQRLIAQALSDTDAALAELDRLITKKRNIKQGAMHQLLMGKKRLPGFSSEWEIKRLGEILKVRHGKSQHDIAEENGPFPILATGGEIGRAKTYLYDKPSVLIGRKGTIDVPQYMDSPFWTIDTLFYTEIFNNAFPKFVFYRFNLINWYSYNEASGVPSLNAKTIENIEVYLPCVDEQQAIAQVLIDMDAEIKALEQKRDKYKAIKQGMMQELLTGRTRLL
ncbi:restriction endonuclease subunit S [Microcoleus sp. S13_C5]|uniref:restriction endonuclease subunit S n=1 Tax=Microcoleus sp. S13_C5 TaxID=3055411 RepID=UPI002FD17D8C